MKKSNRPLAFSASSCAAPGGDRRQRLIPVVAAVLALGGGAGAQTVYSPGGVGVVGSESPRGNTETTANIFAWDIDANSAASGFDTYAGGGHTRLVFDEFRVILGPTVDFNNTFWQANQVWASILSTSGSATITNNAASAILAYTFSGGVYTPVDSSAHGSFSMTGNTLNWSAVPEPTSGLAGLLLVGGLLCRRRS